MGMEQIKSPLALTSEQKSNTSTSRTTNLGTCYSFTWVGVWKRNTTSCDNYYPEHICNPPFVATAGEHAMNGPNITEVIEQCELNSDCSTKELFCDRNFGEVCVKYSKFARSGEMDYYSTFCGKGVDENWDARPITTGCHRQNNVKNGYDIEICFCDKENCISAQQISSGLRGLVIPLSVMITVLYAMIVEKSQIDQLIQ